MAVLRRFARPLLATTFVGGGFATLRESAAAAPAGPSIPHDRSDPHDPNDPQGAPAPDDGLSPADRLRRIAQDPRQVALVTGSVRLGAGVLLALGRFPRVSAAALAATLVPRVLTGQPYWRLEDPRERARERARFYQDVSLLGGLLLAAADTHGKPSLAYRTRHAASDAGDSLHHAVESVTDGVKDLADEVKEFAVDVRDRLPGA
ncbi:DoxX family protein [Streptomyces sp. NPDC087270]|uniref:DoxX family protein n=1 Tax=Streptomyces sp. NPDC087270 TaxID=3365774 RepID=UPI00380EEE45